MSVSNETGFSSDFELTHAPDKPRTVAELADWLANSAALDEAEVYRFIDPGFMREQYLEEAEKAADVVLDDVKRDYYEVDESYMRYLLKRSGVGAFGVVENGNGRRILNVGESALKFA